MNNQNGIWSGEYYIKNYPKDKQWIIDYLESLTFNGDETILDIGCGDGKITAKIATLLPEGKVVGIDSSESMIKTAKQAYSDISNLSFKIADAATFTFGQKFDYIVSFHVFHYIEDQRSVLQNIKRALKPNGKVIIVTTSPMEKSSVESFFNAIKPDSKWWIATENRRKSYYPKTAKEFEELLEQSGFKIKNIEVILKKINFDSLEDASKNFMRWISVQTKLPHNQALELSNEIAQNLYKEQNREQNKSISIQLKHLLIEADFSNLDTILLV